jgi:tetratricopeptide (TPR) repeat protein
MNAVTQPTGTLEQALAHAGHLLATDPALAESQAREILAAVPGHAPAWRLLGLAEAAQRRPADAARTFEALVAAQPNWAQAWHDLGEVLGRCGRGEAAVEALRRAVALKPSLPGAWRLLGDHLDAQGDEAGARHAWGQHLRHATRHPDLLQAADALAGNRLPEAEALLRAHLHRAPSDAPAMRMLAELAARLGRHEDAIALLERCLEIAPDFHAARQNHALVLYRANQPGEALAEVERLLAVDAYNPSWRNLKAVILGRIGEYPAAIGLFSALLAEYPNNARLWISHGHTLKTAGQREPAIAAYRRAIALDPGLGEAWWSLANLKTFRFAEADLDAMRAQLARTDLDAGQRCQFEFALGKALEDRRDWAASFDHYARGNALRRAEVPWRAGQNAARVRQARKVFDRGFFAARAGWGDPSPDPIFVVGLPRSGSTLIEQILSSHSQVEGTMELPELISIGRALRRRGGIEGPGTYYEVLAGLDRDDVAALGAGYLERTRIQRKTGAPRFIDKMPNNFVHLALIHLALPNARIIDARRHPLACGLSCFKQHFARGQGFTYALDDVGRYYRDYVELMAHYDAVLPGRVHRVFHERMVEDTEGEVRRLLEHCGLPFEDACLRFHENDRPVRTASSEQVRRPINRDGVDQWRHYAPWLAPLENALGEVLHAYPGVPDFAHAAR